MSQDITVHLPDTLYEQLLQRAIIANRTLDAELLHVVSTVVPSAGELTPDLDNLLAQLRFLDDTALWRSAQTHLGKKAQAQLHALNNKRQREGLNESEARKAGSLLMQYERAMVVRSKALLLLKERGYDPLAPTASK